MVGGRETRGGGGVQSVAGPTHTPSHQPTTAPPPTCRPPPAPPTPPKHPHEAPTPPPARPRLRDASKFIVTQNKPRRAPLTPPTALRTRRPQFPTPRRRAPPRRHTHAGRRVLGTHMVQRRPLWAQGRGGAASGTRRQHGDDEGHVAAAGTRRRGSAGGHDPGGASGTRRLWRLLCATGRGRP